MTTKQAARIVLDEWRGREEQKRRAFLVYLVAHGKVSDYPGQVDPRVRR